MSSSKKPSSESDSLLPMAVGEKKAEVLNSASEIAEKSLLDVTELLSSSPDLTGLKSELKSTNTKSLGWPGLVRGLLDEDRFCKNSLLAAEMRNKLFKHSMDELDAPETEAVDAHPFAVQRGCYGYCGEGSGGKGRGKRDLVERRTVCSARWNAWCPEY